MKNPKVVTLILALRYSLFSFAQDPSWFKNATSTLGLNGVTAFRMHVIDVNNDNYPDFVVVRDGNLATEDPLRIYLNVKDTSSSNVVDRMFLDVTPNSGANSGVDPADTGHQATTVAFADINNDGNMDMVTGNYYHRIENYTDVGDRCESYLGDGTGKFKIVPSNGLHDLGLINPSGMSFLDYDKDGKIDLFIAVWFKDDTQQIWDHGYLMKGNGDGTFANVSEASGISTVLEPMYGCTAVDWNNDGWPDITTSPYCRDGGRLWKNNGDGTFSDVSLTVNYNCQFMYGDGGAPQDMCMWGNMPEDFDNDGDMDFYFSLVHGGNGPGEGHSTIVMNSGQSNNYHLDTSMSRITWDNPKASHRGDYDASWFDMDNDGLEDLVQTQGSYVVSPAPRLYLLKQKSNNRFDDVTQELGLLSTGTVTAYKSTHAVEVLDLELDGDDDIIFTSLNAGNPVYFLRNDVGSHNNWVAIKLNAPAGVNKNSIGARIKIWFGNTCRTREVSAGKGNQSGQQPFILLFGLGSNSKIDSIKVEWPSNPTSVTTIKDFAIPINQMLIIDRYGISPPNDKINDLLVYPNPAKDYVVLQTSSNSDQKIQNVELYDLLGNRVNNIIIYHSSSELAFCSIGGIAAGYYIVKISNDSGYSVKKSFLKIQ
jgi:hypothetical protein